MLRIRFASLLAGALASGLASQAPTAPADGDPDRGPAALGRPVQLSGEDPALWRAPIHTHDPDPDAGEYGWWAAGRGFKVSFHDGFHFVPMLGDAHPENLPLRWTTEEVAVGGEPVADLSQAEHAHGDWRYEYRFRGVTEAYDVRLEGVEQSFVLHEKPRGAGDLVIRGRIGGPLRCAPTAPAHQALLFCDAAGTGIVRYGEAFAFDAAGRRTAVLTSAEGSTVRLTVPGAWLAGATYPVTVDPLTTPTPIIVFNNGVLYVDVAHDAESHELMYVCSRAYSASDYDTYAYLATNDFNGQVLIYTDLSHSYSTPTNQCCFVGGADKWVIASSRSGYQTSNIALYVAPRAHYTPNAGFTKVIARETSITSYDQMPSIGGSFDPVTGTRVLVAWEREFGSSNGPLTVVMGAVVDVTSGGNVPSSAQFAVSQQTGDRELPCVNKCSQTGEWLVAYQFYDTQLPNSDWDVRVAVVTTSGTVYRDFTLLPDGIGTHEVAPKIEGCAGRYFLVAGMRNNDGYTASSAGDRIVACSFDWTGTVSRQTPWRVLEQVAQPTLMTGFGSRGISYDRLTASHAAVAYERDALGTTNRSIAVVRIGIDALPVEATSVAGAKSPALVFNPDYLTHDLGWLSTVLPTHVYASHFEYQPAACVTYGASCGPQVSCLNGSVPVHRAAPHRGSSLFQLRLTGAGAYSSCVPVFGFGQGAITLPGGCPLLVSANGPLIVMGTWTSSRFGVAAQPMAIPETWRPGSLFAQWAVLTQSGLLRTSNAVELRVR